MAEAAAPDIKRLRKRAADAHTLQKRWDPIFREAHDYCMPYRHSLIDRAAGMKLTENLFDATAIDGAFRFAGRMQQELTPPFQKFFELFAGPFIAKQSAAAAKEIDEELATISNTVVAALTTSNYHLASAEMYLDLFIGTGNMLMLEGDDNQPIRCLSVPMYEVALELGAWGELWGRHWTREWPAWQIPEMWPKGQFSENLQEIINKEPDKPVSICQSTVWNPKTRRHELTVFRPAGGTNGTTDDEGAIATDSFRASPWITPRFMVVPGEPYGRGPGLLSLPFVKTANKTREMELKAAAFAIFGIWMAVDDQVFNPDTARFAPGTFWKVGSAGGSSGPSLQRLEVPGRFDLSRVVMEDEREQIARMQFNRRLPPDAGPVRSPTEIMERIKDLDVDLGGVYGRMALEVVQPTVERAIEILANKKILQTKFTIDQLSVGIKVTSPIANAQKAAKAKRTVDYMQMLNALVGPQALMLTMRLEKALPQLGRDLGIDEDQLRSDDERQQMEKMMAAAAQQQAEAEAAASAPPPEPPTANGAALQ